MDSVSPGSGSSSGSGPETATLAVAGVQLPVVPSFGMRIGPASYVSNLFHSVAALLDIATIKATEDGLVIREVSPVNDFMIEVMIWKECSDEYVVQGEPSVTLNFRTLSGILADAKVTACDRLILGYDNRPSCGSSAPPQDLKAGRAVEEEHVDKIWPVTMEIVGFVGDLLGLSEEQVKYIQETVDELVKRRQAGTKEPKPETLKGREKMKKLKLSVGFS